MAEALGIEYIIDDEWFMSDIDERTEMLEKAGINLPADDDNAFTKWHYWALEQNHQNIQKARIPDDED